MLHNWLYVLILLISACFVYILKVRSVKGYGLGLIINRPSINAFWVGLVTIIIGMCFLVNADFLLAAFYAIFVAISILIVFKEYNASILTPQNLYKNPYKSNVIAKNKSTSPFSYIGIFNAILRTVNVVIFSAILGALVGVMFHSVANIPEVDLVIYTAFVASLSFAGFITYFASTKHNIRAFLYGLLIAMICIGIIALSGKVMLK